MNLLNRWRERHLVRRICRGDRAACAELVRTQHAAVYRWLVHLCRGVHAAEDLVQETFACAWMKIRSFNAASTLATWLHRIAYCKFVDWHRRDRRLVARGRPGLIDGIDVDAMGPVDRAISDERAHLVDRAVAALAPGDREVIALHYFQGLSFRAMAQVLGVPSGTAKWRTSVALERLRTMLGYEDENERRDIAEIAGTATAAIAAAGRAGAAGA